MRVVRAWLAEQHRECVGRMTGAARAYLLGVVFSRHVASGVLCVTVLPGYTEALGLTTARSLLPIQAWGVLFFLVAVPALGSVLRDCIRAAHVALALSVALSVALCVAFLYSWSRGPSVAPLAAVLAAALVGADLTTAGQRLRAPLETVVEQLAPPTAAARGRVRRGQR